jgi:hypothetical protein
MSRAGRRLPDMTAASTSPALDIIIKTGRTSISEAKNPSKNSANTHVVVFIILLRTDLILFLIGQKMHRKGRAKYVMPIRNPASNPAVRAPISVAGPNATNVDSES